MAAAARPYWTGFLKLSLVTIGVRLYTATSERDRIRFHQIHELSGERVRQQLVVPGIGVHYAQSLAGRSATLTYTVRVTDDQGNQIARALAVQVST